MSDFNKGDFTQQGVDGHVRATLRLNEKRYVELDLTTNENARGCTISGNVHDRLNNLDYPIGSAPSGNIEITENGENINVAPYATATVNVSGGGADVHDFTLTINAPPEGITFSIGYTKLVLEPYIHSENVYPDSDNPYTTAISVNDILLDLDSNDYDYPNIAIIWYGLESGDYTLEVSSYSNCTVDLAIASNESYPVISIVDISKPASLTISFVHV